MRARARGWLPGERMRPKPRRLSSRRRRPPPAEHGGIGPEGGGREREGRAPTPGGGSPGHRSGRGRAGERRAAARVPGHSAAAAAASGSTRPSEGGDPSHRASITRRRGPKPRNLED